MSVNKPHIYEPGLYFVTFTNYKWLPLFAKTDGYDLVYKWFDFLKSKGHSVTGYVIMPNHVHALIGFGPTDKSINTLVGDGKRFMAYGIVKRLKRMGDTGSQNALAGDVLKSEREKGKVHEVFEEGFDLKLCYSNKFVKQKLDYIHSNPMSKKWELVKDATEYVHSSAKYYFTGVQGVYEVLDTNEWIAAHWNNGCE